MHSSWFFTWGTLRRNLSHIGAQYHSFCAVKWVILHANMAEIASHNGTGCYPIPPKETNKDAGAVRPLHQSA